MFWSNSMFPASPGLRSRYLIILTQMLLTEAQAARELQVDKRTLRRLIESGRLRAVDIGSGRRRYHRIDLKDLKSIAPAPGQVGDVTPRSQHGRRTASSNSVAAYLPSA